MSDFLIKDSTGVLNAVLGALAIFSIVIIVVRVAGKRATSQMNNFDWLVTVAIGSIAGSTIVLKDVPLLEGLAAICTLFAAQFVVTRVSVAWPAFSKTVRAQPSLLFFEGDFVWSAMTRERVTEQEVLSAIRESGFYDLDDVGAVVLESDARMSVISIERERPFKVNRESLRGVQNKRVMLSGSRR